MGDAGPQTPILVQGSQDTADIRRDENCPLREVNILVTGYGAFKSFATNPSFLIATSLPENIVPPYQTKNASSNPTVSSYQPIRTPHGIPYRIKVHVHPEPVRVAYSTTATDIPKLIASGPPGEQHAIYDYILHIGMAAGRDNYTLETLAHRDHYKIKDVNDRDGFISGEYEWKRQNLPEVLDVGWHKQDVLSRWEHLTSEAENKLEIRQKQEEEVQSQQQESVPQAGIPTNSDHSKQQQQPQQQQKETQTPPSSSSNSIPAKKLDVKLSRDAGRFLCEFILYTSLAYRYKEAQQAKSESQSQSSSSIIDTTEPPSESPLERVGKVAFLHVPGGISPLDIKKGTLVAEAAITALITSWESGFRNSNVYKENGVVKV